MFSLRELPNDIVTPSYLPDITIEQSGYTRYLGFLQIWYSWGLLVFHGVLIHPTNIGSRQPGNWNILVFSRFTICTLQAFNDSLYWTLPFPIYIQLYKHFGFLLFYLLSVSVDLSWPFLSTLQTGPQAFCPPPSNWCVSNQREVALGSIC